MTMSNDPGSRVTSARRRLLRGSLSVPAVLTLSSGAALANTSSLRCFNQSPGSVNPKTFNGFRLKRYSKLDSGGIKRYYIKRTELITAVALDGTRFTYADVIGTSGKDYIRIDTYGGANLGVTEDLGEYIGLKFTHTPTPGGTGPQFAIKGYVFSESTTYGVGNVMYGSCWTSFMGAV